MDKRQIESFKAHAARKALRKVTAEVQKMHVVPRVVQVRPLTASEVDRLMHRRREQEDQMLMRAIAVFGKKKRLPLPTFACESKP